MSDLHDNVALLNFWTAQSQAPGGSGSCPEHSCVPPGLAEHISSIHGGYRLYLPLACACYAVVVCVGIPALLRWYWLLQERSTAVGRCSMGIAATPMLLGMCQVLTVLVPSGWKWLHIVMVLISVAALFAFLQLVNSYVAELGDAVEVLGSAPPRRPWAVFLCCCGFPCLQDRKFTEADLLVIRMLFYQSCIIMPVAAFLEVFEISSMTPRFLLKIQILSMIVAVYALIVLIYACGHVLSRKCLSQKFWTLKVTFIFSHIVYKISLENEPPCLHAPGGCYTPKTLAVARSSAIMTAILVPMAILLALAYPVSDVDEDAEGQPLQQVK
eukprot:gnl/TRDRNA2_/TRDRNA2_187203_c0_seq1.p1 gnl/TRDRNA2_/TRDRNA2_187203_c0~~gnl/TRDRNA2_/TRDRNA2_187203_c0_seq1.p1  ORF type:complete len:327 (-),score=41.54 gnl/TRDRNA2_/TRDRNA2_187203_c0_seq1:191-1171(-)